MTYASPASIYEEPEHIAAHAPVDLVFVPRSKNQWIAFLPAMMLCGVSWMAGGVPELTDMGFLLFTVVCGLFVTTEFYYFPRRFGIGGLVLYGGTLCWFCQDYFTHWFGLDFNSGERFMLVSAAVVAKAAALHVLFIMLMSVSLNWTIGRWMEKLILIVPEPGNPNIYLIIVLFLFCFALCPYVVFNAEPIPICIYHALFAGWTGPAQLWVYRTGNLNYSWGAYVAQIMQVGEVGGIVAIIYAILIARSWFTKLLGFAIWLFSALIAFETGRRGNIAFHLLPPIAMLFIKFQAKTAAMFKRFSIRAYLICGVLAVGMFWVVQFQGTFRGYEGGYNAADLSKLDITKNQGNTMFSEGLIGYSRVGVDMPFFNSQDFPGEGMILAIPHTVFDLVIGIIPRALWPNKPVDALWSWYNKEYTGVGNGTDGTTIAHGLIGGWYFKYGLGGMIEGALLVGWLMGISERALQHSNGQPIGILMSLAFATWLFRIYRDFIFIDLYGLILGGITLTIIVPILKSLIGSGHSGSQIQSA